MTFLEYRYKNRNIFSINLCKINLFYLLGICNSQRRIHQVLHSFLFQYQQNHSSTLNNDDSDNADYNEPFRSSMNGKFYIRNKDKTCILYI
jgi:hypothetical protein